VEILDLVGEVVRRTQVRRGFGLTDDKGTLGNCGHSKACEEHRRRWLRL
jgi:hypothetical protein